MSFLPRSGARVLDAGCGEGRNAVELARHGADVTAVDISPRALDNGRAAWTAGGGSVRWLRGDVRRLDVPDGSFDAVLACSVLHWLDDEDEIRSTIDLVRRATRPGGLNALVVFNDRHPYRLPEGEHTLPCLRPHRWYLDRYADWSVPHQSDTDSTHTHAGHPEPHTHGVSRLIARRPRDEE